MKRFFTLFAAAAMLFAAGCESAVDLSEVNDRLDSLEQRMSAAEALLKASENGLYIVSVQQTTDGYVFFMSDGSQVAVYNGKDGADGKNGADGTNGSNGTAGDSLIKSIAVGDMEVTFTLTDGRTFSIPLYSALSITFDKADLALIPDYSERNIHYTVQSNLTGNITVEVVTSADILAEVVKESATTGYININTTTVTKYSRVLVFVSNGEKTILKNISLDGSAATPDDDDNGNNGGSDDGGGDSSEEEEAVLIITNGEVRTISAAGGELEIAVETNLDYTISIAADAQSWVSVKETRALRSETVVFEIAQNDGGERSTIVDFLNENGYIQTTLYIIQHDTIPDNEIHYTSSDGNIVEPNSNYYYFGKDVHLVSNTYKNGIGIMRFDNPVNIIGEGVFHFCTSLTSITIPEGVTEIGTAAFSTCISLINITIPGSVVSVGEYVFQNCYALSEFRGKFASNDGRCLIVDNTLKAFAPAGLTEYSIPYGVTTIGYRAFYSCRSLTSITIPNSVTEISDYAFAECTSLTSITIPNSVTEISDYAFAECTSLTSIIIPENVTKIGKNPFWWCDNLSEFRGKLASNDGRCLITEGVLCSFAPAGFTGERYSIPNGVIKIGVEAFHINNKPTMLRITIPEGVTEIDKFAFVSLNLASITLPNSVAKIGRQAFGYTQLATVTIPENVKEIHNFAFDNCLGLRSVYCKAINPPTLIYNEAYGDAYDNAYHQFYNNHDRRKFYVPNQSLNAYKTAEGWSRYADDIVGYDF